MGAFYGGVYAHGISQDDMVIAAKSVAESQACPMYVAPTIDSWTAAYPCNSGQDVAISKALAEKIPGYVIHALVHDDDVFVYELYRDGVLIDEFNSNPDYFGPVTEEEHIRLQGDASDFEALIPNPEEIAVLGNLLEDARDGEFDFASEALYGFAEILNLPNALTCYEYLEAGETEHIQGWESFVKVR